MDDNENKCAHAMCDCTVGNNQPYCSDHCKDAKEKDIIEIRCDCGHPGCS